MQGFIIIVSDPEGRQILGIDTKFANDPRIDGKAFFLPGGISMTVTAYKETNKEPLWRHARRWLLIQEANLRVWIRSRAERGQSDLQTRTPVPVTDAAFHAPLTSVSLSPESKQALTETITSGLAGFVDVNTQPSESFNYVPCAACVSYDICNHFKKCAIKDM